MDEIEKLSANSPATLESVLTILNRIGTLSEVRILELASSGRLVDWAFEFAPHEIPEDTVADQDLVVVASPVPTSRD